MIQKFVMLFFMCLCYLKPFAQQIPLGECGIVCTYDAIGNRLKRVYFCNNGVDPYPMRAQQLNSEEHTSTSKEYQSVDALFPNPTTGRFYITFSKELKNARISLSDLSGKIMQQFTGNGFKLSFDLSTVANGIYYVRIEDNGTVITKKVIKH